MENRIDTAGATASTEAFATHHIRLSIDGHDILSDVNLSFPKGEFVALVGHNGSGKSSLLKILGRQILPTARQFVTLAGQRLFRVKQRQSLGKPLITRGGSMHRHPDRLLFRAT